MMVAKGIYRRPSLVKEQPAPEPEGVPPIDEIHHALWRKFCFRAGAVNETIEKVSRSQRVKVA